MNYDKSGVGGGGFKFPCAKECGIITVGVGKSRNKNKGVIFSVIMHEICEIIHVELCTRLYGHGTMGHYSFQLNHQQFQTHNSILSDILFRYFL